MEAKIVFVFILSVLLGVSLSLPISLDVKTVQLTDSVPERELTERTTVLDSETTILTIQEDNKLVQSLITETLLKAFESFEADTGKRIKRHITKTQVLCPKDMFLYSSWCLSKEEYEEYNDLSEGSDYETENR